MTSHKRAHKNVPQQTDIKTFMRLYYIFKSTFSRNFAGGSFQGFLIETSLDLWVTSMDTIDIDNLDKSRLKLWAWGMLENTRETNINYMQ